jgi:hypothetical protein
MKLFWISSISIPVTSARAPYNEAWRCRAYRRSELGFAYPLFFTHVSESSDKENVTVNRPEKLNASSLPLDRWGMVESAAMKKPVKTVAALKALKALQDGAKRKGLDKTTMDEINAEIAAHRREKRPSLAQFLLESPLRGSGLKLERRKDYPRPVDFE